MAKLGEVCKLNMGQSPDSSSYNDTGDGIPFFQGNADFGEVHPNIRVWCNAPTKIAHPGEILISVRAPIGAMNIADCECCIGRGLASISADEAVCTTKYLWYGISSKIEELNAKGTGSTFKAVNKKTLEETEIPIRDLMEQERIAAKLDSVTALITLRKQQLKKLDELVKARFVEMFGDSVANTKNFPSTTLETVMTVFPQNGLYKPQTDYVQDDTGIPILRIDAFYNGKVTNWNTLKRLICSETEIDRYLLRENDIVINRVNSIEYLGKCAHIVGLKEKTVFESNMMRFHMDEKKVNAVYVTEVLCTEDIYRQILRRAKKSVNQASINQEDVKSLEILVPPLSLQNQFAAFVERVDQQKQTVQQSLEKLELMKKALMQEYFG